MPQWKALKYRFKPVDIEELQVIEFHQLVQGTQSVEELGIELQKLAKRAFPVLTGKDLDRLLKGRFFQALLPCWQRKLGAPNLMKALMNCLVMHTQQRSMSSNTLKYHRKGVTLDKSPRSWRRPPLSLIRSRVIEQALWIKSQGKVFNATYVTAMDT